jgi:catechol 2,3-dioxygenase-like lactoylglutathione lyase family enzyme
MPLDHVGLAVPHLDAAVAFFRDVLGAEPDSPVREIGPDDGAGAVFGMDPELSVRFTFLQIPGGGRIEVAEFRGGLRDHAPGRPGDPGGAHLAVVVEDRDAAVERALKHAGVEVRTPREPFVYLTTPWGGHLQLIQQQD